MVGVVLFSTIIGVLIAGGESQKRVISKLVGRAGTLQIIDDHRIFTLSDGRKLPMVSGIFDASGTDVQISWITGYGENCWTYVLKEIGWPLEGAWVQPDAARPLLEVSHTLTNTFTEGFENIDTANYPVGTLFVINEESMWGAHVGC